MVCFVLIVLSFKEVLNCHHELYRQRSTQAFFAAMSDLYHYYDLYSTRKYVGEVSSVSFLDFVKNEQIT